MRSMGVGEVIEVEAISGEEMGRIVERLWMDVNEIWVLGMKFGMTTCIVETC